jgi:hypothetical protein
MSDKIEFTKNNSDLSTDSGFQFEFVCERCGTGYRSTFKEFMLGQASNLLNIAGSLFGGVLGRASGVGQQVKSAAWERAHDGAFREAIAEMKPDFIQCPRCSTWVCRKACWNDKKGLCKQCAPDLGVEMAAAQASKSVEEVWAHAKMAEEDKKLGEDNWRKGIRATCPQCEKPLAKPSKFCPECGATIGGDFKCAKCGAKLEPNAKFCPECGEKAAGA